MSMSKKDFIALADVIRDYNKDAGDIGQCPFDKRQTELLADFCYQQNSNFNRDRWLAYVAGTCGPNGGVR